MIEPLADQQRSPRSGGVLNAGVYAAVSLVSGFWILLGLLDAGQTEAALFMAIFMGLLLILRIWFVGPVLFLVMMSLLMQPRGPVGLAALDGGSLLFAAATVTFVLAGSRYVALVAPILPYSSKSIRATVRDTYEWVMGLLSERSNGAEDSVSTRRARLGRRRSETIRREEFISGMFRVLVSLLAAFLLLIVVPLRPDVVNRFGLVPMAVRAITLGWLLLAIVGVSYLLAAPVNWFRHTPREAGVFLRSVLTRWCARDMGAMVKRQVKHRRKSVVARVGREKGRSARKLQKAAGQMPEASFERKEKVS